MIRERAQVGLMKTEMEKKREGVFRNPSRQNVDEFTSLFPELLPRSHSLPQFA